MCRLRHNPRYNWLHDLSHSDVLGGVVVGVSRVAAQATPKLRLVLSVGLLAMSTRTTRAASVTSVDQAKRYAVTNGAVFDKLPQLEKAPTAVLSPLRLFQPYPVADAREVLELDFASGAFSRFNEVLGNFVVRVGSKAILFSRHFLQSALSRRGAALLQVRTMVKELLPLLFDLSARKGLTVGGRRNLGDAKVNAERTRRLLRRLVGKPALQMDVPLSLLASDKLPALNGEGGTQEVPLIPANFKRDGQSPVYRCQRERFIPDLDAKDALVIVNTGRLKAARSLSLPFPDPSNSPHSQVRRQSKLSTDVAVGQLLEGELVERIRFPRNPQNVVARRRKSVHGPAQAFGLTRLGYQLTAHAQEGHMSVYHVTSFSRSGSQFTCACRRQGIPSAEAGGFLEALQ